MTTVSWEFWIDVGGTFTDCLARSPQGDLHTVKVLSSGTTKGQVTERIGPAAIRDDSRCADSEDFWRGYRIHWLDDLGVVCHQSVVTNSRSETGELEVGAPLPDSIQPGSRYELVSGEEAPVLAIRKVLELRRDQPIPPVTIKLGTTRGTNALLERKGARTAFITTRGFADVLLIGNQDRPRLFDLAIEKPAPLIKQVIEIDERLDRDGNVLIEPEESKVREQLLQLKAKDIDSVAICLLHSFTNPAHEQMVERIAREVGFEEISTSSRLSPLIKIVSRGDTTVMDAYLNPILRDYVGRLRRSISAQQAEKTEETPSSTFKLMTSAGGLVNADHFVGKDSILSGPAGGVIGFSRVAQRAGFEKSIGFDMGGTSTDVARFDGNYEREFETTKAGVRVVAPMLAIETVAAGGGSICGFDGVKLHVGPESAGADPGPACYGRGGPLTVTDLNLYLGKIIPSRFPFPLDRQAVDHRLRELCDQIADSPMGKRFEPLELAEGFLQIANESMVRPIRKISVARGYDPAEYALVSFGGAGAQHACAVAKSLGIRSVLIHPYAGILSAYGIGLADVRRFGEESVLQVYSDTLLTELEPAFIDLERRVIADVQAEGIETARIETPIRSLDLRYRGVESTINVPLPEVGTYAERYEQLHRQLYGYTHPGREIEVTAMRVEVVGKMPEPVERISECVERKPEPRENTQVCFSGQHWESGVFEREELHPGDEIAGPAIICEPTSTVVIEPGWTASIRERGEILLCEQNGAASTTFVTKKKMEQASDSSTADPVLLEIFNNLFASIAEQMGLTLQKTSFSTNVKERLDFSCAIFSSEGELVVNAPHIPVHLGAMSETVKCILKDNPRISPGDVFVTNDPYRGGSHLPDVTVVTPVFGETSGLADSEILFFTASRAHHAEIGGIVPGSMPPFSKNLAEEGVLIRNFKLVEQGRSREQELRELLLSGPFPTRSVDENLRDVAAQVAANQVGVQQLNELIERYSLPVVQAYMQHIQQAATEKMRLALAELSDGVYRRTDHLDDGSPIAVTISIQGESAVVDFTGTGPVLSSNLNANRAIVTAAVLYVFRCLIREDIPLNGGVLKPVEIVLPECLLNPPEHDDPAFCPAVVGGNVETSQRVVDVLLGALEIAAASQGTMNNLTFGNERFGYYETICGGSGATTNADGADAVHTHMTNTRLTDAEVLERRYPLLVREFSIRKQSGGSGQFTGGDGIVRKLEFLEPLKVSMLSERRGEFTPFGLQGGGSGARGENRLMRAGDDESENLGGKFSIEVAPGDVLTIKTPGGGGFGEKEDGENSSKLSDRSA
ncbi:MAG: hydantoinase B/oxoprolinase family protein [Planctomycetaceae bacterium]